MYMSVLESTLSNLTTSVTNGIPNLIYAIIILVVGYAIGRTVGTVVEKIVARSKVDSHLKEKEQLSFSLSNVLGTVSKWVLYLIFMQQAAVQLNVAAISQSINEIINFIPGVIGAVVVLIASYAIAIYVKEEIVGSKGLYQNLIGKVIFFLIVYVGIATALPLIEIDAALINNILLILVASMGLGLAIALGLGLKDTVSELSKGYVKKTSKKR